MSTPATTRDIYKLEIHPLANVFPPMSKNEYETFKADIKTNGIRLPITLHEGKVSKAGIGITPRRKPIG
jgi:hypothetical protein